MNTPTTISTFVSKISTKKQLKGGLLLACVLSATSVAEADTTLYYGHNNSPNSVTGQQARWLAEEVSKNTNGEVNIEVYPSSQLGNLKEMSEAVSTGSIAITHNTAAAIGSLYEPFEALDTPYLYRNYEHLMKVFAVDSPVMEQLNQGLIENSGVRVLYAFYFGARELTADRVIRRPSDLEGVKIRAVPFPMYTTAVEGLGAIAVPVDWSEVPTALATGVVSGQENPVNVILDNKLYDVQSNLMLTNHISSAEVVVMNESAWEGLSEAQQEGIRQAATTVRQRASQTMRDQEQDELQQLADAGMTIVGPEDGLDVEAFKHRVQTLVNERFGDKYGELYDAINAIQ